MPEQPNHYELKGHSVSINYGPDLQGQLIITFKVENLSGTAHKKDIHTVAIDHVGQVITFALKAGPDGDQGDPQFSFLLPTITLEGNKQFETVGFKTITTRQGPAHQRYTHVQLHGTASSIQTLTAGGGHG